MSTLNDSSPIISFLLQQPAMAPPVGVESQLGEPLSLPAYATPVATVTLLACTICIILRLVAQLGLYKQFTFVDGKNLPIIHV